MARTLFSCAVLVVALAQSASGGAIRALTTAQAGPTFRSNTELVVLHVSVRDGRGRYVSGLTEEAFTVIDGARPQPLSMFSADSVPASIAFLIDNSNSMQPNRDRVIAAAVAFAGNSNPRDEISVLTFNEEVRPAFGPAVAGDVQPAALHAAMSRAITARGMTAVYDGILAGLHRVAGGKHIRQVIILVSDGGDNASEATLEQVRRQVQDSDATIYSVILIDPVLRDGNPRLLRRLAEETGGEAYQPGDVDDVPAVFERIARDIRSAYTLAYAPGPDGTSDNRRRRAVKVYVRSSDGRALKVRARDGYFVRATEVPQ